MRINQRATVLKNNENKFVPNSLTYNDIVDNLKKNQNKQSQNLIKPFGINSSVRSDQTVSIKMLQEEIQLTAQNYEMILLVEKKKSSQRSQFLLYLIQSLKMRHNQQLQGYRIQLQQAEDERLQALKMDNQMKDIGANVQNVVEESKRLKIRNQFLVNSVQIQQEKQRQLDEYIDKYCKEIEQYRAKIDSIQKQKLKWNQEKRQMLELIDETDKMLSNQITPRGQSDLNQSQQDESVKIIRSPDTMSGFEDEINNLFS